MSIFQIVYSSRSRILGLLFVFLFLVSIPANTQTQLIRIDSLMKSVYHTGEPGSAIAILQNNQLLFSNAYGVTDLEQKKLNSPTTIFNVGSITKQFTAMAILQLEATRKISLEDKLGKFFPKFSSKPAHTITIRNLLTHSSGLVDHYSFVDTTRIQHGLDNDVLHAVENLDSSYFDPGKGYRYSNTAFCLLALIIQKVSGLPYAEYIQKNIFRPLGMKQSFVIDMKKPLGAVATGYEKTDSGFKRSGPAENLFFTTQGDGGVYTSVQDYIKWWNALQDTKWLKKDWVDRARAPQHAIDTSRKLSYGFGWFVSDTDPVRVVYHTGSNGGFRAIVFTIPSTGYAVVIFSNRTGVDLEELVKEINKILRVNNKSFFKLDKLISFQRAWPIFAPCKETILYSTSLKRNWNARGMALN